MSNKNLKVLHSAALLSPPSGILMQMKSEQEIASKLGLNWEVKMYMPDNNDQTAISHLDPSIKNSDLKTPIKKINAWFKLRKNYHDWLLDQQQHVDVFLLRYYVHDPFQLMFLKKCKKPVYLIHHTLEEPELKLAGGVSGFIRSGLEKLIGKQSIALSKGVVGVTQEIINYEKSRISFNKASYIYPNGIVYKSLDLIDKRNLNIPELLFVANFAPWHGLDLILNQLVKNKDNFILHLVGEVPENLMPLTVDPRVVVHGKLTSNEISTLSSRCWVGLACFSLQLKKMYEACPLKVREYLMLGLPVYGDYIDIFPKDVPYFRQGSSDINQILVFAFESRNFSKQSIAYMAKDLINKENILEDFYSWLEKN